MKNLSLILLALVAFISSCTMQVDNEYHITGTGWEKYNGNEMRIVVRDTSDTGLKVLSAVPITNGKFIVKGEIEHPQTAFLGIYNEDGEFAGWKQDFIVEAGIISLDLKVGDRKCQVSGGKYYNIILKDIPNNKELEKAGKELEAFSKKFYALKKEEQTKEAQKEFMIFYNKHSEMLKSVYFEAFTNDSDPYVRLLCLSHLRGIKNLNMELDKLEEELGLLPEISTYKYGIKRAAEMAKNRTAVGLGSIVRDFTAEDLKGNEFNLAEVLKDNKYVLVEFWASWCSPCRAEIPHMKEAYDHFTDKDFEIVSFTLDHLEKSWKKASDKEQIPWINVGDLKAYKSPVVQMYGVQGVPANFLVNSEGEIIAINLRGKALDDKLVELLN